MYEHAVIHVPCRKATYIHLFYSILSLFGECRLIFTCITVLGYIDEHMELLPGDIQQCHMTCGPSVWSEHKGNTPLFNPWFVSLIFNNFRWCFIHLHTRICTRYSQSISDLKCILDLIESGQLNCYKWVVLWIG